jgi:GAF domain-containing protein
MTLDELARLRQQVATLETANQRLREEYGRAASQHAEVALLLAACHRLHSTLDRREVLTALEEILGSLVGCEEAAVYELGGEPAALTLVKPFGIPAHALPPLPDAVLPAMLAGRIYIALPHTAPLAAGPSTCLPLRVDGRVTGAIALFRLLEHKPALTNSDWELLDVISVHAATALIATSGGTSGPYGR